MRRASVRVLLSVILLGAAGLTLAACNTVRGMGQDLQQSSDAVQKKL